MRTTLDIDDDLLLVVKRIARRTNKSAGSVVSDLLRQALRPKSSRSGTKNGVPLLQGRSELQTPVALDLVNNLRDGDE